MSEQRRKLIADARSWYNADIVNTLFPNASKSFLALNQEGNPVAPRLPRPKPEPVKREKLLRLEEAPHSSPGRTAVIVTRCSAGSLDRDNLNAANKAIIDALRYSGRILGDREADIELICLQRKVKRKDAGTLIEIIPLKP